MSGTSTGKNHRDDDNDLQGNQLGENVQEDAVGLYDDIVVLTDESGQEVSFDHLMTFEHLDEKYVALLPLQEIEGVEEDEVILLRIVRGEEEDHYVPIESEIMLQEVFETFTDLFEEMMDEVDRLEDELADIDE